MGVAVVDDDRQGKFPRQADETAEDLLLVVAGRTVAVEVEADLADGDDFPVFLREILYDFVAFLRNPRGVVGMNTDGGENLFMPGGKCCGGNA